MLWSGLAILSVVLVLLVGVALGKRQAHSKISRTGWPSQWPGGDKLRA